MTTDTICCILGAPSDRLEDYPLMEESLNLEEEGNVREKRAVRTTGIWPNATIPFEFDTDSLSKFLKPIFTFQAPINVEVLLPLAK